MSEDVIPVRNLTRRVAEQGRIRFGVKGDKGQPKSIQTFRFTSPDRAAIIAISKLYGGKPSQWAPSKGRSEWQVITEATEIAVYLPPEPLGDSPIYELWSGGGLVRRCDGETCEIVLTSPDGAEVQQRACICNEQQVMSCKVTTRMTVVLPDVRPFGGGWRLETKGWNAAHELPGMVDMIQALQDQGLTKALLCLEKRTKVAGGKTHHFMVPVLKIPESAEDLLGGALAVGAASFEQPAIEAAEVEEEVIEAEAIVDDPAAREAVLDEIALLAMECELGPEAMGGFRLFVTGGLVRDLTIGELNRVVDGLTKIKEGKLKYVGLDSRGWAKFTSS